MVVEAFSAPWKAAPQLFALTLHPPQGTRGVQDSLLMLMKRPLDPSWVPGTDLSVPFTGN